MTQPNRLDLYNRAPDATDCTLKTLVLAVLCCALLGALLVTPFALEQWVGNYLTVKFPVPLAVSPDDAHFAGLNIMLEWTVMLVGTAIGVTKKTAMPVFTGLIGGLFLHAGPGVLLHLFGTGPF